MKKIFLTFFLISFALVAKSQKAYFGVDAGINVANQRVVSGSNYRTIPSSSTSFYDNLIQPTFSAFYHYNLSETIGLRANVRYMGLGYSDVVVSSYSYVANSDITINYLTLPISIHYGANKHLSLNAGTYVSFTVGGKDYNNADATKTFHKNDFGFSVGGEHDIYKNFAIGITYLIGAKNVWLNDQGGQFVHTNRALQIALIYKFKKQPTTN